MSLIFNLLIKSESRKPKIKTGSSRTAGRHTFVRQQKYAKVPFSLRRASPLPGFRDFNNLLCWGSGPVTKGLTLRCSQAGKRIKSRLRLRFFAPRTSFSIPCAAAGSEWIKDDQRNELSEALAEFSFRRLSSFRLRGPCAAGQGFGCPLFAYFIWACK